MACPTPHHACRLINDHEDVEKLSELGVLFLLFEMGLELSFDRLKALAKYAFGMGSLQVGATRAVWVGWSCGVAMGQRWPIMHSAWACCRCGGHAPEKTWLIGCCSGCGATALASAPMPMLQPPMQQLWLHEGCSCC